MNFETLRTYFIGKAGCTESFPFGPNALVFKVGGKMFGLMSLEENPPRINLKCDPERALELRAQHNWILPGYHMSKKHWNTVVVEDAATSDLIMELIDHSYEQVFNALPAKLKAGIT